MKNKDMIDKNTGNGQPLLRLFLCVLLFVLQLKFCYPAGGQQEQSCFPMDIWEWIFLGMYPLPVFTALSGFALAWAGWTFSQHSAGRLCYCSKRVSRRWIIPVLAWLPVAAGFFGLVHTTEWNYAFNWMQYFIATASLVTATWMTMEMDDKMADNLLMLLAISGGMNCLYGWYQHFGGLEANLEIMRQYGGADGHEITEQMLEKLAQTRIYGFFSDPNVYAAHVLLTFPPMLLVLWRTGKRFEPARISCPLLSGIGLILAFGALFWSGSRGAALGFAAELGGVLWFWLSSKTGVAVRTALLLVAALVAIGGMIVMTKVSNRDFSTASIRMEYYQTAWTMFKQNPLFGKGVGEFFTWHMRLKPVLGDEARDAHSQFFAMLSQCGFTGGIAALLRLLFPVLLIFGFWKQFRHQDSFLFLAICAGWIGWEAHSLVQFDDMIPGTCVFSSLAGLLALAKSPVDDENQATAPLPACTCRCRSWGLKSAPVLGCLVMAIGIALLPGEYFYQAGDNALNGKIPNVTRARSYFEKAASCQIALQAPWRTLGDIALRSGEFDQAMEDYTRLSALAPHRSSVYMRLFKTQLLQGKKDKALEMLTLAEDWYPTSGAVAVLKIVSTWPVPATSFERLAYLEYMGLSWKCLEADTACARFNLENSRIRSDNKLDAILDKLNEHEIRLRDGRRVIFERTEK